ncbi:MAG: bifunctional UDP-N-acetylglucosamine diphosphorylase/glucosamine-1-phosphate N-acetyltransferase GlmU [Candidatus Eremiobacteraeota bacterium]|nr:bifunctional UDP-N-acetylglucosamine diphosphorylase/glucosamine-1-phosphate N-acetyltransferase GlmU [Candidatus Eremiobacteraeota bacterium]
MPVTVRAIVLAAGKGTRMKGPRPKVLHEICGRPMLWYVLRSLHESGIDDVLVVASDDLQTELARFGVPAVVQSEQLGTGHAVKVALRALSLRADGRILVASGDMPLVTDRLFAAVASALDGDSRAAMALVTVRMPLPSNFGRIVRRGREIERIVEVRDAAADELAIEEMNAGIYAFDERALRESIDRIGNDNAQKEYYLTDTVADFVRRGRPVRPVSCPDHFDVLGINDRVELAAARREMNARLCARHMRDGVTIVDPETTYLEPELSIGRETVIYPNTSIGLLSEVGESCIIGPNSRLSNAKLGARVTVRESVVLDSTLGDDCNLGPFAHLRGETVLGPDVRIGNFVEIKKSTLARGVKASHLSYLGDAQVGEETNVGAGTITCNFDGEKKNETVIGSNVFIGSNSSLVAPLSVGDGALTGAGSVVTHDVAPNERVAGNPARPLGEKK